MTNATQTETLDTLRALYRAAKSTGEMDHTRITHLLNALDGAAARKATAAFLALGWIRDKSRHLGDVVRGEYHGVPFLGVLRSFDGSGVMYVYFPLGYTQPVVFGIARDGIAIDERYGQSCVVISRPSTPPEVKAASYAAMGGAYLVGAFA